LISYTGRTAEPANHHEPTSVAVVATTTTPSKTGINAQWRDSVEAA